MRPIDEDYRPVRVLGQGAYGEVWLVTNKENEREQFAMKKIPVKATEEGIPQSVVREVASLVALKQMKHPNILRLHDAFIRRKEDTISLNIVCEKCDWDLCDFLRKIPHEMCNAQCKHFARQILSGIDFLHSNTVIHRDLKPQNILVNKDHTLRIADFGLSRNYGLHATFTTECKYGTAVDLWSAGCILAELYTRDALFKGDTEAHQLRVIFEKLGTPSASVWPADAIVPHSFYTENSPPSLANQLPRLPASGVELLKTILHFNPHERPTAAESF
uniref:Protein kinase domain-containing protein n=1 Tax=Globodera rostochiensis TaxID=31243 RepID=A0A914HXW3_GLORO